MIQITLRVQKADERDIGKNIIRIDTDVMDQLNIQPKDVIKLIGKKESVSIAMPSYSSDIGLGIIRIDSRLRKNTDTYINDTIKIQKIAPQPAQKVILAPVLVKMISNPEFKKLIKRKLKNYPITLDDYVFITMGVDREIAFKVMSLTPGGVCNVKQETSLQFTHSVTEFDILTNMQLKNLENFLKKCDYSKEELVTEIEKKIIVEEDWIRDSKVKIKHVIEYLLQENDLNWLISKIALDLNNKYEKAISQGQAEAVLRRVLGITLSSTGRSQLNELRKKIRRYEKFLRHFGEWDSYDFTFKVVITGLSPEQATKLIQIPPLKETRGSRIVIGVEFYPKPIKISDKRVKLQLWNVSTEKRFNFLIPNYYLGANGAIIVYNKNNRESFDLAKESHTVLKTKTNLQKELKEETGTYTDIPVILIGLGDGKIVSAEEGQSLAKEWGAYGYIEMKEADSQNFENVLSSLSLGMITNYQKELKKKLRR